MDHYNLFPLKQFAATVASCMDLPLPGSYAPPIAWASRMLKARMNGPADRVVLYHADAVGLHIWQKYTNLFAPVYKHTSMSVPFLSTVESVTPVAHASMYTGLDPAQHGIQTYDRPRLACSTLYDELIKAGKKAAIVYVGDSTFKHIFSGRDVDYFEVDTVADMLKITLELIAADQHDLISIHTWEYDHAAHEYGPEAKEALNALSIEAEAFDRIAQAMHKVSDGHRMLLTYSPDHGQHLTEGGTGAHGSELIEDMNVVHFFGTI